MALRSATSRLFPRLQSFLNITRSICSASPPAPKNTVSRTHGIAPPERLPFQTHEFPVYSLPFYGADPAKIEALPDSDVNIILKAYGGLMRKDDEPHDRRERLVKITRERLSIVGVVVSDRMDKSVVVAARRRAFVRKLRAEYEVTRRFMAHDEQNLCREGDRVMIRICRPLSKRKHFVVVKNYGEKTRIGFDNRASILESLIASPTP